MKKKKPFVKIYAGKLDKLKTGTKRAYEKLEINEADAKRARKEFKNMKLP
jgi:lysozyme family protein